MGVTFLSVTGFKFKYLKSRGNHSGSSGLAVLTLRFWIKQREQFVQQTAEGKLSSQTGDKALAVLGGSGPQFLPGQPRRTAVVTLVKDNLE